MDSLHPSQGQQRKPPDCLPAALLPWGYPTGCWGPGVSWWARGSSTCRSTDSTATCWSRHTTRHDTTRTRDTPPVSRDWLSGISGTSYLLPPPPPPRLSCFSTLLYSTSLFRHCVHQWWPKETSQCSGQTPIIMICRLFGRFRLSGRVWLKAAYYRGLTLIIKFRRSSSIMVYFWFLLVHTLDPLWLNELCKMSF